MTDKPAEYMEEEQEGVAYIRPHMETKLSDQKRHECREIVKEIKSFGVNQRQILFLIDLLALELEDINTGKALRKVIVDTRTQMPEPSAGLILPTD